MDHPLIIRSFPYISCLSLHGLHEELIPGRAWVLGTTRNKGTTKCLLFFSFANVQQYYM